MSLAISSLGIKFKVSDGSATPVFTSLSEVIDIDGPGMDRGEIDVTNLDSPNGWKENMPGFKEGGQYTLNMNFTHASFDRLLGLFNLGADYLRDMELVFLSGAILSFTGWVKNLKLGIKTTTQVTATCVIRVSGPTDLSS